MDLVESMGLRVNHSVPGRFENNVDINTQIKVEFNSELDTGSIYGNFYVLEDKENKFEECNDFFDIRLYESIKGNLTYKEKCIFFTPLVQLEESCRYIVYVPKGSIQDYKGRKSSEDVFIIFTTNGNPTPGKVNVIKPLDNSIIPSLSLVEVEDITPDGYIIQISRNKDFENGVYDKVVHSNIIKDDFGIGDGQYFIRAKAIGGEFGDTTFFTVKSTPKSLVSDEDEEFTFEPLEEVELEVLQHIFSGIDVSEKINLFGFVVNGLVDVDDINLDNSFVVGNLTDDSDEGAIKPHTDVDGSFSVTYSELEDKTYILYIPNEI